jgi:hypothetical protein
MDEIIKNKIMTKLGGFSDLYFLESVIEKKEKKELFAYSHQLPIGSLLVLP